MSELEVDDLVADASAVRSLAAGEVLVREGDVAHDVFVVTEGRLEAITATPSGEVVLGAMGEGAIVGEITVIAGGRRTATLRAAEPTEVQVVPRERFEQWLAAHPDAVDDVSAEARTRIDRSYVTAMIAELVGAAEPQVVQEIVDRVEWRRLASGDVLFEQGDPSDAAYFVVAGRLLAQLCDDDGEVQPVREMIRGDVVGELGLLERVPRSATVRALRDTTVARFGTELFDELVMRSPAMMLHVARSMLGRLRSDQRQAAGRIGCVAVVVTAPGGADGVVSGMAAAISRFGSVQELSSTGVDRLLNRDGISQSERDDVGVPRLAEFLHEADVGNDYLIFTADPLTSERPVSGWTRRALRQSDRVVLVCSPAPDGAEQGALHEIAGLVRDLDHVALTLALLHPPGADRPRGTAVLVDELGADDVVHLRSGDADDVARLGRLATGNGVGLVLGGGGARGFAHLGVYRALVDAGVPVDAIAGCSIGAPLGAAIAIGTPGHELVPLVQRQFHRLLDYTVPIVSLVKGRRISGSIVDTLGGWEMRDLWTPFLCVSTNLTKSRLEVHRRGDVARAVRASVAIPGVMPPVPAGDDLLVDGGVMNNLPVDVMRADRRIGTVVAVDVAPERGPRARADYGTSVTGLQALRASMGRGRSPYPSATAVLLRSMLVGAMAHQRNVLADGAVDLLVRLDLPGVGLLEFERVREVERAGYEAAVATVDEWAVAAGWKAGS